MHPTYTEVLSERLGRAPEDIIKLDANENPYGPPPEVMEAMASMKFPHIYPDPECRALRKELGEDCGVPPVRRRKSKKSA